VDLQEHITNKIKHKLNEDVSFKDSKYHFYSKSGAAYLEYNGIIISTGDFDSDSDSYWMNHNSFKGQKSFDTGTDVIAYFKKNKIVSEIVNEGIWPKAKLSDRFQFLLATELKKKFKGIFYVVGYDLYHNDKKIMAIDPDKDSVNSIVNHVSRNRAIQKNESVNESTFVMDNRGRYLLIDPADVKDYKKGKSVWASDKDGEEYEINKKNSSIVSEIVAHFPKNESVNESTFVMDNRGRYLLIDPADVKDYKKGKSVWASDKDGEEYEINKKNSSIVSEIVETEQLDEKLITFSNRAPYGQVVFMAGGAGCFDGDTLVKTESGTPKSQILRLVIKFTHSMK
jgi:hypothetical protein